MRIIIAVTGASGVIYAYNLLKELKNLNIEVFLIISETAKKIIELETDITWKDFSNLAFKKFDNSDLTASIASGSFPIDGMVIVPCSMSTLAAVAQGYSDNLIRRAANCTLKENRPLILVPRETPLSLPNLENLVKTKMAGAVILPAMPGFYHKPKNLEDLVNFVVGKILDLLKLKHNLYKRWGIE
ncbi:MAG: UbiX family flavin prenyltransferase [Candidatus Jordarchaeum sp.]|uniref:UbiX family flavin prenyltransferase n=1 Tax=Candidatus Jordarchaeum sp. TaxID=2823881 RepID=UPI004049A2A9